MTRSKHAKTESDAEETVNSNVSRGSSRSGMLRKNRKPKMRPTKPCLKKSTGMKIVSSAAERGKLSARKGRRTAAGSSGKSMRSALKVKLS